MELELKMFYGSPKEDSKMKIGFVASAFDLLHPGHLALLEESKKHCEFLVVGLHTNPKNERPNKNQPVETVFERYLRLQACKYVDHIIPYDTEADLVNLLSILKPDVRFLGSDYSDQANFTGKDLEIKIIFVDRAHNFSSSNLRSRLLKL